MAKKAREDGLRPNNGNFAMFTHEGMIQTYEILAFGWMNIHKS